MHRYSLVLAPVRVRRVGYQAAYHRARHMLATPTAHASGAVFWRHFGI
jgi:hypothetical protein